MQVQRLSTIRHLVGSHFGPRALYRGTVRYNPDKYPEDGFVRFLLYDSFTFGFGFTGAPYSSLSCFYEASKGSTTTVLLGMDLAFIENTSESIAEALNHVDQYCRLRLPDKFLNLYDSLQVVDIRAMKMTYASDPKELRQSVEAYFGAKGRYLSTRRNPNTPSRGSVRFVLYDTLVFSFALQDPPYDSIGMVLEIGHNVSTTDFLGEELTFVENHQEDVSCFQDHRQILTPPAPR